MLHKTIGSESSNFSMSDIQESPAQELCCLIGLIRRKSNEVTKLAPMIHVPDTRHGRLRALWKQSGQNGPAEIL